MTTAIDSKAEIFLHIGTMKSGTSYIQAVLRRNKRLLSRDGVLVPRTLVPAVVDVLGRRGTNKEQETEGAWARFLNAVESWNGGRVLASQEFLSGATAPEAQAVVDTLPKGQVKVVVTNRDLLRVIPSHWQTVIKNGGTWPFPEYVRLLLEAPAQDGTEHRYSKGFWRHHDVAQIIENWASAVGMDNVVLVTVPRPGAPTGLLWQRFSEAIGLDASHYDDQMNAKSNVSLSFAETEMLREVNMRVRKPLGPLEYRVLVNKYLANKLLRKVPETGTQPDRPTLGALSHQRIADRADSLVTGVAASGVRVIGDVEELRVPPYTGDPEGGDSPGPRDRIPESVPNAIARLVLRIARLERDPSSTTTGGGAKKSAAQKGAAQKGAAQKAGAQKSSAQKGGAQKGSAQKGGAQKSSAQKGGAQQGQKGPGAGMGSAAKKGAAAKKTPAAKKAAAAKRAAKKAAEAPSDDEADFESFEAFEATAFEDDGMDLDDLSDDR